MKVKSNKSELLDVDHESIAFFLSIFSVFLIIFSMAITFQN